MNQDLVAIAELVADKQDSGQWHFRTSLDVAKVYYTGMRRNCRQYRPYIDPTDKKYVHTVCVSGFKEKAIRGDVCLSCPAFCPGDKKVFKAAAATTTQPTRPNKEDVPLSPWMVRPLIPVTIPA